MHPILLHYFEALDTATVSASRQAVLQPLVAYIQQTIAANQPIQLTFICTHNSRRSHLGQVWAAVAAHYYQVPQVTTFSGGTEATACNPRTLAALERAGFNVVLMQEHPTNSRYLLYFDEAAQPVVAFSKIYDEWPNPTANFAAIMTCDHAEQNCPFVPGATARLPIKYRDPKESDDSPQETATYDARCKEIATEMKWVFEQVKQLDALSV